MPCPAKVLGIFGRWSPSTFLCRGVAVLRPAKDLGSFAPFGIVERTPAHGRDRARREYLHYRTGQSVLCPYQTISFDRIRAH